MELDLNRIFSEIAEEKARIEAEEARAEKERLAKLKDWERECEKLHTSLISQAAAKAEHWMKANLILSSELLRVEEFSNGLTLHLKVEGAHDEPHEWEINFLFFFGGESPDSLSVSWADVYQTRKSMESYYPCDY